MWKGYYINSGYTPYDGEWGVGSRQWGNVELLTLTLSFPCNRKRYYLLASGFDFTPDFGARIWYHSGSKAGMILSRILLKVRILYRACWIKWKRRRGVGLSDRKKVGKCKKNSHLMPQNPCITIGNHVPKSWASSLGLHTQAMNTKSPTSLRSWGF